MKNIRQSISDELGYRIEKDRWDEMFKALDASGKFTLRSVTDIILVICKYLEERENGK